MVTKTFHAHIDPASCKQTLLPPITALISGIISVLRGRIPIDALDNGVGAVLWEIRQTPSIGVSVHGEIHEVALQLQRNIGEQALGDVGALAVVESVCDILAVEPRRDLEFVRVCRVVERLVDVKGVADEDEFVHHHERPAQRVGVRLASGVYWRIEDVEDVVGGCLGDPREHPLQPGRKILFGPEIRGGEAGRFESVVSTHDRDILREAS